MYRTTVERGSVAAASMARPFEPAPVAPLAAECRSEEGRADSFAGSGPMTHAPSVKHVHVIMLDTLVGQVCVHGIPRHRSSASCSAPQTADHGAADQHAALRGAAPDRVAQAPGEVRVVIVRVGAVSAEVDEVVADVRRAGPPDQLVLEGGAGMSAENAMRMAACISAMG